MILHIVVNGPSSEIKWSPLPEINYLHDDALNYGWATEVSQKSDETIRLGSEFLSGFLKFHVILPFPLVFKIDTHIECSNWRYSWGDSPR